MKIPMGAFGISLIPNVSILVGRQKHYPVGIPSAVYKDAESETYKPIFCH